MNKPTYTEEQKQQGRELFSQLRSWGSKGGKPASSNMKLAGAIALLNDVKENLVLYRQYDQLSKVDNLIQGIQNYKVAEQERISALVESAQSDNS